MQSRKINVAIAGLGNCASSMIQGIHYYKNVKGVKQIPGLMHVRFGKYHISDIKIVAAFDINKNKIGKDISTAIFEPPNSSEKFQEVPHYNVKVHPGPKLDGVAPHMEKSFFSYKDHEVEVPDVAEILQKTKTDVLVNFLPVGSEKATQHYAQAALDKKVAFANGIPSFIVSNNEWAKKFTDAGTPCAGDDIKSQLGATILHRVIMQLMKDRGVIIDRTFQLNIGGNTDFENMKHESRLASKRISKTKAVTSVLDYKIPVRIGPSDYVPFLEDEKICYINAEGRNFGDQPVTVNLKLSVQDSPNSAGVMIDVIRALAIAQDRKIGGPLYSMSSYAFKHPPKQVPEFEAHNNIEQFIKGDLKR